MSLKFIKNRLLYQPQILKRRRRRSFQKVVFLPMPFQRVLFRRQKSKCPRVCQISFPKLKMLLHT